MPLKFSILFSLCILPCLLPGASAAIDAGTETAHASELFHTHAEDAPCAGECLAKAQSLEAKWLGGIEEVTVATRYKIPISKATSIVTVITAEEIKNLGCRTFIEVLRFVPGFEILKAGGYGASFPVVRGLHGSDKIKVMLNGHLVNASADGAVFDRLDDFPVENIKRIEIIRGPGSALYGENAILAVVNIITFDASDIDGVKITSGYGSFDTYEENAVFGKTVGKADLTPSTIESYEVGLSYRFNKYVTSNVNYFYNNVEDSISTVSTQGVACYENAFNAHIQGFEMETRIDIARNNYIFMNYTFQNPEDSHGDDLPATAQHFGNFGINTQYWKYINSNVSTFVSGRRSRDTGDTRDDMPAYALLNLSVIGKDFFNTMEVQGTVFNLLDKDYRDPASISIPETCPGREGRFG